jgi:hypothetical protein
MYRVAPQQGRPIPGYEALFRALRNALKSSAFRLTTFAVDLEVPPCAVRLDDQTKVVQVVRTIAWACSRPASLP